MPALAVLVDPEVRAGTAEVLEVFRSRLIPRRGVETRCVVLDGAALLGEEINSSPFPCAPPERAPLSIVQDREGGLAGRSLILDAFSRGWVEGLRTLPASTAFVVWDPYEKRLWAAGDAFGARPLYFLARPRGLAIASQIEVLLSLSWVPKAPDPEAVHEYLRGSFRFLRNTFFAGISRIQAGHVLIGDRAGMRQERYYAPTGERFAGRSVGDAIDAFHGGLRKAVVGTFAGSDRAVVHVSGGIDSSSVAVMAGQEVKDAGDRLLAASAVFPGLDCDETPYIHQITERLPYASRTWSGLRAETSDLEGGESDLRVVPIAPVAIGHGAPGDIDLAREWGASAIVSGEGGNQVSWEEGYLVDLLKGPGRSAFVGPLFSGDPSLLVLPTAEQRWFYSIDVRRSLRLMGLPSLPRRPPPERPAWEGPALAAAPASSRSWVALEAQRWACASGLGGEMQRAVWDQLTRARLQFALEFQAIRLGRVGMVALHPYLDVSLADLAMSVPSALRPWRTGTRALQRYALRTVLPLSLLRRRSRPVFNSGVVFHASRAVPSMRRILSSGRWDSAPWLNREALLSSLETLQVRRLRPQDGVHWNLLRRACAFEGWLRREFG